MHESSIPGISLKVQREELIQSIENLELLAGAVEERVGEVAASRVPGAEKTYTFPDIQSALERLIHSVQAYQAALQDILGQVSHPTAIKMSKIAEQLNRCENELNQFLKMDPLEEWIDTLESIQRLTGEVYNLLNQENKSAELDLQHMQSTSYISGADPATDEAPPWDTRDALYLTERLAAPIERSRRSGRGGGFFFVGW